MLWKEITAGLAVVAAIFISALVAGAESIRRLIDPSPPTDLWVLAGAGAIGYLGNSTVYPSPPA